MVDVDQLHEAVKEKFEKQEEQISRLEREVRTGIRAVTTDDGELKVIATEGVKENWFNKAYMNKVLEDHGYEIVEKSSSENSSSVEKVDEKAVDDEKPSIL